MVTENWYKKLGWT